MPFGGSKSKETPKEIQLQGELTALQSQAAQKDEELAKVRESLDSEKLKAEKAEKEALSQKSQAGDYKHQLEEIVNLKAKSDGESQILFKEKAEEFERKERESFQKAEEETSGLRSKLEEAQKTLDKEADEKAAREGHKLKLNEELTETKQALEETKVFLKEKEEAVMTLSGKIGSMQVDKASPIWVLDVAIGECEFASPFAYFLELQLEGHAERRCTDVSQPSTRPVFTNASQLLSTDPSVANHKLKVCAFLNVEDHSGNLVAKLLGTALVSLGDLKVADGSTASKRVSRAIDFLRDSSENTAQCNTLVVGRTTLEMKVKVLLPSEMATMTAASSPYTTPRTQLSAGNPFLDKSLWAVRLFEHRLRVLIHHAGDLPVPEAGRATLRVALRFLQA